MTRSEPIARPAILTNTTSWKKRITQLFLVGDMPKEFYDFWYFCKKLCPNNPAGLKYIFYCLIKIDCCIVNILINVFI